MMTSSNGDILRITGHLCGEFTGHRWIPRTKASDAELWYFLWSAPELVVEQTIVRLVIWDAIVPIMTSLQWMWKAFPCHDVVLWCVLHSAWTNYWTTSRVAGDFRRQSADVTSLYIIYHMRHFSWFSSLYSSWLLQLHWGNRIQGLYWLSGWTSYRKISWNISEPRDSGLDFSNRSEICQAPRDVCQMLEWYDPYNIQSRGFETARDLAVRRSSPLWIEALRLPWG